MNAQQAIMAAVLAGSTVTYTAAWLIARRRWWRRNASVFTWAWDAAPPSPVLRFGWLLALIPLIAAFILYQGNFWS